MRDVVVPRRAFANTRNTAKENREIKPNAVKQVKAPAPKPRQFNASPKKHPEIVGIDREYQSAEYMTDVYNYLLNLEKQLVIEGEGVNKLTIKPKMRSILVDWLVQVHGRFHLFPETLHLTVYLVDCCLAKMKVEKTELQLVGMACMLVACKFEEMYVPDIKDFEYIADNAFTKQQIMKMEIKVLGAADYMLSRPHSTTFIRWLGKEAETAPRTQYMAKYFAEIALLEETISHYLPSQIALLSLYLAHIVSKKELPTKRIAKLTNWTEDGVTEALPIFVKAILRIHEQERLAAVRNKYSSNKFHAVANIPLEDLEIMKRI